MDPVTGPTLLGFDVYVVGSILVGIAENSEKDGG